MPQIDVKMRPDHERLLRERPGSGGGWEYRGQQYSELQMTSNFSFLRGASHPEELIYTASGLGYRAAAVTDRNTLAGVVRAFSAAKKTAMQFIVGAQIDVTFTFKERIFLFPVLAYPVSRAGYANLCRMLTAGKIKVPKDEFLLLFDDFMGLVGELAFIIAPPFPVRGWDEFYEEAFFSFAGFLKEAVREVPLSLAFTRLSTNAYFKYEKLLLSMSKDLSVPLVVTNNVLYHSENRAVLQDVLSAIRLKTTLQKAGFDLEQNTERFMRNPRDMYYLYRDMPQALTRTNLYAEAGSGFSMAELKYEYPESLHPPGKTAHEHLRELTLEKAKGRYPDGIPEKVMATLEEEFSLIQELQYEKYFLTCNEIVEFARSKNILCQGRGAAANSVVCYCLGITAVNPVEIKLLFARFVSRVRKEPPDIDIDFEHERREEVIQHIYNTYGRHYAGLTCAVITYRSRMAVRDVGKALGLSPDVIDRIAKSIHHWTKRVISEESWKDIGVSPDDRVIKLLMVLVKQLIGFPRHLSQHVGGFIISKYPLSETVPISNARMKDRTIIEWDKDDIEVLGMLKIDVLALGMLTCIRKCFEFVNKRRESEGLGGLELYSVPRDDTVTYDMICQADTVGVFQIESRAQMSMLPRLRPRCFYDLVIQVAIVRPGPIHGNMVHPFLRRRNGTEVVVYPDDKVREILERTMGVPIFQEQAMELAIQLAEFTPDEAELLRRSMSAWKKNERIIESLQGRIMAGMVKNGYTREFAEGCLNQMKGFSEYGFPQSHAASFALLAYVSSYLKAHYSVEFAAALLNSLPMGFYAPAQIVSDLRGHGFSVLPIDVNYSGWDHRVESVDGQNGGGGANGRYALRLGMRLINGMRENQALLVMKIKESLGFIKSIDDLWLLGSKVGREVGTETVSQENILKNTFYALARADAFNSLGLNSRQALWQIKALPESPFSLPLIFEIEKSVSLPLKSKAREMIDDFQATDLSLKAHPIELIRDVLDQQNVYPVSFIRENKEKLYNKLISVCGISIVRQRPGTAKGMLFITLEDDTGLINLLVRPPIFEKFQKVILTENILIVKGLIEKTDQVLYMNVSFVGAVGFLKEAPKLDKVVLSYSY